MVNSCCAFGCKNRFKKNSGIGFFRFPSHPVRKKLWTFALRRKNFEPSKTSVICGEHFQTGKPSKDSKHPDYVPNIFNFKLSIGSHQDNARNESFEEIVENIVNDKSDPKMCIATEAVNKILNQKFQLEYSKMSSLTQEKEVLITESSVEAPGGCREEFGTLKFGALRHLTLAQSVSEKEDELLYLKLELQQVNSTLSAVTKERDILMKELSSTNRMQRVLQYSISNKETEMLKLKKQLQQAYMEVNALRREKEELQKKLSATNITDGILEDPVKLRYYTGLNSVKDFHSILSLLSSVENSIKSISLERQVLIVLMKLKLNLWNGDLAHRFQTSSSTIQRICLTIIPPLEMKLNLLVKNPVNNALKKNIPVRFKNTVYENLYQRLHRNFKSKTKQPENVDTDLEIM